MKKKKPSICKHTQNKTTMVRSDILKNKEFKDKKNVLNLKPVSPLFAAAVS